MNFSVMVLEETRPGRQQSTVPRQALHRRGRVVSRDADEAQVAEEELDIALASSPVVDVLRRESAAV